MILILGGEGAGKRSFALSLGYFEDDFTCDVYSDKPVLINLEKILREDCACADDIFAMLCKKSVVTCCEVGSGIIPLDKHEREYRETTGRLCVRLAREAGCVVRMTAGIPMILKGELPCE